MRFTQRQETEDSGLRMFKIKQRRPGVPEESPTASFRRVSSDELIGASQPKRSADEGTVEGHLSNEVRGAILLTEANAKLVRYGSTRTVRCPTDPVAD